MQRRGKTATERQSWFCPSCRKSSVRKSPSTLERHRKKLFVRWLCGNATLAELARGHRTSLKTLRRYFEPFWKQQPIPHLPQSLEGQSLIVDAVSLEPRCLMALIGRTRRRVVQWTFAERESFESWSYFYSRLPAPSAMVCDGRKGLLLASRARWTNVKIQRCLIHIVRQANLWITQRPKTLAGQDLRILVRGILSIRTRRQKRRWIRQWRHWHRKYRKFLNERSYGDSIHGKRSWWYTHRKLRAVRSLIRNSLPDLFTFVGHPEIPRTSNHVEGGINSRLKELLHRHRGLSLERKQVLTAHFLHQKQIQKPPRNVH